MALTQRFLLPDPGLCSCAHHSTDAVSQNIYLETSDVNVVSAKILQMDLLQRDN